MRPYLMALPPTVSSSGVHVLPTVLRARQVLPRVRNKLARRRLRVIENFRPTRSKRAYLRPKDYDRGLRRARIGRPTCARECTCPISGYACCAS